MIDWLGDNPLPIGRGAKSGVDWLIDNFGGFFDGLSEALQQVVDGLLYMLETPPTLAVIVVFGLLSYLVRRSLSAALFTVGGLLLIVNLGYWEETTKTLALVIAATSLCMAIGVPLGIAAARRPWLYALLRPVLDLMQTIPTFVYLIPALILFGLGMVPGLIATIIFAVPRRSA